MRAQRTRPQLTMSEYQYYEFQAFDRLLSDEEMRELRRLSTRARITRQSFSNHYHYGDFSGDPNRFMDRYFDAFVYFANWGTRWFMVRVPGQLLDVETALAYWVDELFSCRRVGDQVILSFCVDDASGDEWLDEEGLLSALATIRPALMRGDHRALYLGWLLGVQFGVVDAEEQEPPVPPGLGKLTPALDQMAEFLGLDPDLIAAASVRSGKRRDVALVGDDIRAWVARLAGDERDTLLTRLIADEELHLPIALQRRVAGVVRAGVRKTGRAKRRSRSVGKRVNRRTAGEILVQSQVLGERRKRREADKRARARARRDKARAAARAKYLRGLIGKDESLWADVERAIALRTPKSYDRAVSHLVDLRDLADMRADRPGFKRRLDRLYDQHRRKRTLLDRIDQAELLEP